MSLVTCVAPVNIAVIKYCESLFDASNPDIFLDVFFKMYRRLLIMWRAALAFCESREML